MQAVGGTGPVTRLAVKGVLGRAVRDFSEPDEHGAARLRELDERLSAIRNAFPGMGTDVELCRLTCELLEGAWRERATSPPVAPGEDSCACPLCTSLPVPPQRRLADYAWRESRGRPLTVKTWPYRPELDSVLTGGWVWARTVNDLDRDLGLRFRYEDDIPSLHEYERVATAFDVTGVTRDVAERLGESFNNNGARALVAGLFTAYKRFLDHYWLDRHLGGNVALASANRLDKTAYVLLQLMDCLFWQVAPSAELWQEEHLAQLVVSRVLDDMTDARADAVTGEMNNLWLSSMSTHDKATVAACAIAQVKYGCMPESHGLMWNSWLTSCTMVWIGLTGRHALWFDGITNGLSPARDCPLCGIEPNSLTGLFSGEVGLHIGPKRTVATLGDAAARLAARCREECPNAWRVFHTELAAFEAVHGEWRGDVDLAWAILRRTYIAGVIASLAGGSGAEDIQVDAGAVGADVFHALHQPRTCRENIAVLAYMFGCAHPHFLWNCAGSAHTAVAGDLVDY